jgi:ParB/RepB/Spo0J family partition protein
MESVSIEQITPDEHNVRRRVDADKRAYEELKKSIESQGIIQPLILRPIENGYRVVAGHRRLSAARDVGLTEVPAEIKEMTDAEAVEQQLVENLMRVDIDAVEEASGYFRLAEMGMSKKKLAERIGKSQSHITQRLKLLELPASVLAAVKADKLPVSRALELVSYVGEEWFNDLFERAVGTHGDVEWLATGFARQVESAALLAEVQAKAEKLGYAFAAGGSHSFNERSNPTAKWKTVEDFDLSKEQLDQLKEHPEVLGIWWERGFNGGGRERLCVVDAPAMKKLLGLKNTLTSQQQEQRERNRLLREAKKRREEIVSDVALQRRLPESATDLDKKLRYLAAQAVHGDYGKKALKCMGVEPSDRYGWEREWIAAPERTADDLRRYVLVATLVELSAFNPKACEERLREWGYDL